MALALIGGALLVVIWKSAPELPQVRLNDGSILRLESIRYKPRSAELPGRRWINHARGWIAQRFHRPVFDDTFAPPDSLVYWISRHQSGTGASVPMIQPWSAAAIDSHGCEFSPAKAGFSGRPTVTRVPISAGAIAVFPRRERQFTLRFFESGRLLGELQVPNPAYRCYPTWTPDSLPATRPLPGSTVTLASFETVWGTDRFMEPGQKQFTLTPQFQLPLQWQLEDVDVEDASGNCGAPDWPPRFGPSARLSRRRPPWEPPSAQFCLCTNERAWKLSAKFLRTADAPFESNEIWKLPNFQIPAPGVLRPLNSSNTCSGVSIRLCAIAGPAEVTYSNGVPIQIAEFKDRTRQPDFGRPFGPGARLIPVASDKPQLLVQVSNLGQDQRWQAITLTSDGTTVCPRRLWSDAYCVLSVESGDATSPIELCFIVQQPQVVEFFIQPTSKIGDFVGGRGRLRTASISAPRSGYE